MQKKKETRKRVEQGARKIHCQRMFVQGEHSQFFEVRQAEAASSEQARPRTKFGAMQRIWERSIEYVEAREREKKDTIAAGGITETTPWIRRTGWDRYLKGCSRNDLLASVAEPEAFDEREDYVDVNAEDLQPCVDAMVWKVMGEVAAASQRTVRRSGVMLRMEAVRSEKDQQRFQPLQPYQAEDSIQKHCRPWQQMLLFFVRTQRGHEWRSPRYRFNRRQAQAFTKFMKEVEYEIRHS